MPREALEIRLLRETLEHVLHPNTASGVLFDALQEHGEIPASPHALREMVSGPLARRLGDLLGEDAAGEVLQQIEQMLRVAAPAPRPVRRRPSRHEETTRHVELSAETLPVFVLASSRAFAHKLSAALGPHVMSTVHASDAAMLRDRLAQVAPAFVIVDGSDFPAIEPSELVDLLAGVRGGVIKAIWGTDLPYGGSVLAHAHEHGVSLTPFDRHEGIAPLLDMIRSRRA